MPKHIKTKDIIGTKHGKLTIIDDFGTIEHIRFVLVKCECGVTKKMRLSSIRVGSKSCGCENRKALLNSITKHGLSKKRLYTVWGSMKGRCKNKKDKHYFGRGIAVCKEWRKSFVAFYNWAVGNGYKEGLTIDRKDNDGNYEPDNCRWIPSATQQRNVRKNIHIEFNGETKCLAEWCEIHGLNYKLSHQRIFRDGISLNTLIDEKGKDFTANKCRLTAEQVLEISKSNLSANKLAEIYGVHEQTVYSIKNGSNWSKITGIKPK